MATAEQSRRRPCTCSGNVVSLNGGADQQHLPSSLAGTHEPGRIPPRTGNPSNLSSQQPSYSHPNRSDNSLEASFVYLPPAPGSAAEVGGAGELLLYQFASGLHENPTGGGGGLVGAARHAALLADIAEGRVDIDEGGSDVKDGRGGSSLCRSCVERVARAIDADTARYERETQAYVDAVAAEEDRERQIRQALSFNAEVAYGDGQHQQQRLSGDDLVSNAASAFQEDIDALTAAVHEYEQELEQLNRLLDEQVQRAAILSREEDLLFMDQNDIEIDAAEFETVSRQLTSRCSEAHCEVMSLSKVNLHAALFDIIVNDDQLPRINGMRLSHRPKGDLGWAEMNCAWASAAQLLLFIGGTVKFTSRNLRIVPMTSCAKIMEITGKKKYIHNLGRELDRLDGRNGSNNGRNNSSYIAGDSMAMIPGIRAFRALQSEVLQHVLKDKKSLQNQFRMTISTIGSHDLMRLHEEDSTTAAAVIRYVAKNLEWLLLHTVSSRGDPAPAL